VPYSAKHFARSEWRKNPDLVDASLIDKLDAARDLAGLPIHIHVAWDNDGHSPNSYHYRGEAVDFHFDPGLTHSRELEILETVGFGGIGFYPEWRPRPGWHADIRQGRQARWVRVNGVYRFMTPVELAGEVAKHDPR